MGERHDRRHSEDNPTILHNNTRSTHHSRSPSWQYARMNRGEVPHRLSAEFPSFPDSDIAVPREIPRRGFVEEHYLGHSARYFQID